MVSKSTVLKTFIVAFAGSLLITACGKGDKDTAVPPDDSEKPQNNTEYKGGPVELLVQDVNTGTTDEQFLKFFVEPIQKKYPQIKLTQTRDAIDKLLAAGTPPDIVLVSNPYLATIQEADIPEDLTQMIKTYSVDLQRFEPALIEQLHKLGGNKEIHGLPFAMNYGVLTYNKDLFDKFGVAYPKETNSWEELLELAKKLTRTDSGTAYIGIMPSALGSMYWQYGVPVFDKSKNSALLTTDQHAKVFSLLNQFYSIPGYIQNNTYAHSSNLFFKEFRVGMYPGWIAALISTFRNSGTQDMFNWDITSHPYFSDKPGYGREVDFHMAVVNKSSSKREAAYQVLLSITSDEVQTAISKAGRMPVLTKQEILDVFGQDSGLFEKKNLKNIFLMKPAPLPEASKFDPKINALLNGEVTRNVVIDRMDINTALRNAEEKANKEIVAPMLNQ